MKKKNLVVKGMAMMMACAMIVGNMGIVAHAWESDDGAYHGDGRQPGGNDNSASISIGGDSGSSSSGGGSSNSGSSHDSSYYDDGAYHGDGREPGGNDNSASISIGDGNSSSVSYSAPTPKAAGSTTSVTGKETFRALAKSGSGTYKVTHKGVEIATFTLMDADKKAVPCTAVALKQREDGKWAINFQVTEKYAETTKDADTTDLTVGAPLDRTYMYNTLGVSYVTINDEVIIDIEAEAAAAKTAK